MFTKQKKIEYLRLLIFIGFVAAVAFHYFQGVIYHKGFPFNTFLNGEELYGDFSGIYLVWPTYRITGVGYGFSYFPAAYLFVHMFTLIKDGQLSANIFLLIFLTYFFIYSYRFLRSEGDSLPNTLMNVLIIAIFSYPCLFGCATTNYELICFIFTSAAVWLYTQKQFSISSLLLAVAIAMKLVPAVFILLFIVDKKYLQMLWMGLATFLLTITPLLLFVDDLLDGGFATYLASYQASVGAYFNLMVLSPAGNHFGHSLLNMLRAVMGEGYFPMEQIAGEYTLLAVLAAIGLSCYIAFIESKLWKKTALIVCMMNLLPYTSTDYKLLYLFIPLLQYVNEEHADRWDWVFLASFSLLLIPKYYLHFADDIHNTSNTVINALSMLTLVFFIVIPGLAGKLAVVFQKRLEIMRGAEDGFDHAGT